MSNERQTGPQPPPASRAPAGEAARGSTADLEQRVRERTADLARTVDTLQDEVARRTSAERRLRDRSEELRSLAVELTLAEQRERRRMAGVLHDHLQQLLVAARFRVGGLRRSDSQAVLKAAEEIDDLIAQSIEVTRTLTGDLCPDALGEAGLLPGLEWLSQWMQEKHGLEVRLEAQDGAAPQGQEMAVLLFQCVRELLFNVVKHAKVGMARVMVDRAGDQLRVVVEDEGVGFDAARLRTAADASGGFGLFAIRERLGLLGGRMEIESGPGRGSRFTLLVPA